jgi:tRNA splicing ligase
MPIKEISIRNTVFREKHEEPQFNPSYEAPKGSLLERLHSSRNLIQEKAFGKISAFNFNRDVFNGGHWNDLTIKARGLFLDNTTGCIVARGFEKFFGYKEKQFNSEEFLKNTLKFPASAYVKYNGFLGILGFDENGFLFCSKSTVGGEFAKWFEDIFKKDDHRNEELLDFMRKENVGLVFEVIDPVHDTHIVEYEKQEIVLLDIIRLEEEFEDSNYEELCEFAEKFNFKAKEIYQRFNNWDELHKFLEGFSTSMDTSKGKEGYVISDGKYQFKLKGAWYKFWKWMRTVKDQIARGRTVKAVGMNVEATLFCGWAQRKGREYCEAHDIISLRNEYEKEN